MIKLYKAIVFRLYANKQTKILARSFESGFKKLEETMQIFEFAVQYSQSKNLRINHCIFNVAAYINTCSFDLKTVTKAMLFEKGSWQQIYFARQICLIIYEATNDLPNLTGKEFRQEILKLSEANILISNLNDASSALNQFKKRDVERLKTIRHLVAAHREKDFIKYNETTKSISTEEAIQFAIDFDSVLNKFGNVLNQLMNKSSKEVR